MLILHRCAVLVFLAALAVHAQAPATEPIRVSTSEVLVDLVVRDGKGRAIRDLQPGDLQVLEDGRPAQVTSLRLARMGDATPDSTGAAADPLRQVRLVSILFDPLLPESVPLAREAAGELVRKASGPGVYFAVMRVMGALRIVQPYTNDQKLLKQAIDTAALGTRQRMEPAIQQAENMLRTLAGSGQQEQEIAQGNLSGLAGAPGPRGEPDVAGLVAQQTARLMLNMVQASSNLNREVRGRPTISALRAAIEQLAALPGRKTLVYIGQGLQLTTAVENQFRIVIDAANRAGVSVYCIDATGLSSTAKLQTSLNELRQAMQSSIDTLSNDGGQAVKRDQVMSSETAEQSGRSNDYSALAELASSTGGFLLSDSNDLRKPLERLTSDITTYYEVAYIPPASSEMGFRKIEMKVNRKGVRVQARRGYLATPAGAGPKGTSAVEVLLEKVIGQGTPGVAVEARLLAMRFSEGKAQVEAALAVPFGGLAAMPATAGGDQQYRLGWLLRVRDERGRVVFRSLREGTAQRLEGVNAFQWREPLALPVGRYGVEVAVVDLVSNATGVFSTPFEARPPEGLWVSDPVLVSALVPAPGTTSLDDPLSFGGTRIQPAIGARLALTGGQPLPLFLRVQPAAGVAVPPKLELTVFREGIKVGASQQELQREAGEQDFAWVGTIPASALESGHYEFSFRIRHGDQLWTRQLAVDLDVPVQAARSAVARSAVGGEDDAGAATLTLGSIEPLAEGVPPESGKVEEIISTIRGRALGFVSSLPSFYCLLATRKLTGVAGKAELKPEDSLVEMLSYVDGHEKYTPLKALPTDGSRGRGVNSTGEFGGVFGAIFEAQAEAQFVWKGFTMLDGERAHVLDYRVEAAHSSYALRWDQPYREAKPGFHGSVLVDEATLGIRRVTLQADQLPKGFPFQESLIEINYRMRRVGGSDYLLPYRAVVQNRIGKRRIVRNELEFRDYRKWGADAAIKFDDSDPK
ncbi:MAG: VWA domain-containing protein [Acidobacteria bacterium]|nr:VWA domain-containing protein [Acidobacteriota bacterium]